MTKKPDDLDEARDFARHYIDRLFVDHEVADVWEDLNRRLEGVPEPVIAAVLLLTLQPVIKSLGPVARTGAVDVLYSGMSLQGLADFRAFCTSIGLEVNA